MFSDDNSSIVEGNNNNKYDDMYDEKYVLTKLMEGITREGIAKELGHKNYRTIDMYMRRHGYAWDGQKQLYVMKIEENNFNSNIEDNANGKIQRIITYFSMGMDPMEIAKRLGFNDHKTMAAYMKAKDYIWSSTKSNYVLARGMASRNTEDSILYNRSIEKETSPRETYKESYDSNEINTPVDKIGSSVEERLHNLLPMLEMIGKNKDRLAELLSINDNGTIPRYIIGGIGITKSLCMSHLLSELVKEYSKEKNISQREIFEVAIVEFLMKYGYANEVNALFRNAD